MKKPVSVLIIFFLFAGSLVAQRPLDTWRSFLPYNSATQVVQSPDRIYCATPYSIFYIEKSDGSMVTLDKTSGLSDADVRHIAYNTAMNTLVITYASSNIDLLVNGTDIYNIPDIKNAVISGSKNINDIAMIGNFAYLATDLGISVLDLQQQQIDANYIIGSTGLSVVVHSIASDGVNLFAATAEGLKSAPLSAQNLQDFAAWTVYGVSNGLPPGPDSLVGQINGKFYTVINDTLYEDTSAGSGFAKVRYDSTWTYAGFAYTGGYLYACQWGDDVGRLLQIQPNDSMTVINLPNSPRPLGIATDGNTNWIADNWNSLCKYNNFTFLQQMFPDGPPGIGVFRMSASNNMLYLAAGGTDNEYIGYDYNREGPIFYNHSSWQSFPIDYYGPIADCYDLVDVAVDNARHIAYYASLRGGLVVLDLTTNSVMAYDTSNSPLKQFYGNQPLTKISALCIDHSGNVWMSNTSTPQSLVMRTPDNVWSEFTVPNDLVTVRKMMVDSNGYVWMGGRTTTADNIVVFNPADTQFLSLTAGAGNGNLPNSDVWSMVSDKEGNVWVGTDVGIATFYCTGSLFSTPGQVGCDATWIKVDQGGYIGYLFSTEVVLALAVDGADRKWVGTSNGVWLISADGTQQLLNFNTDNSPLPSNSITDIEVDQSTGEVWIGTEDGLVSYQGDAILGGQTKGTALVYPNPVKSDYNGPIAIKGLVDNAYVKITDAGGTLVYEGEANGGEMIWNGQGYSGNKVSSGVYIVYADASDGSQHNVAKIVFIK